MILPVVNNENGIITFTQEELTDILRQSYNEGYEDGCTDTYMQCISKMSDDALNKPHKKYEKKQQLNG